MGSTDLLNQFVEVFRPAAVALLFGLLHPLLGVLATRVDSDVGCLFGQTDLVLTLGLLWLFTIVSHNRQLQLDTPRPMDSNDGCDDRSYCYPSCSSL